MSLSLRHVQPGAHWTSALTMRSVMRHRRGDCSAFVDYFIGNSQCSSNDQQFKSVVRGSPKPDSQ